MQAQLQNTWDRLRTNFWFVPSLLVVLAIALALSVVAIDNALKDEFVAGLAWVYTGGPEGARALLSTVAGSVITVAGTTFSITIAALTLASSQLGPRLLRNFVRDRGNQIVLGTFIATFMYCLLVLRTIRGTDDQGLGSDPFTPHIAVTMGVLLAVASIGVLIYFIHHVAISIQVDHIVAVVSDELQESIQHLFPKSIGQGGDAPLSVPDEPLIEQRIIEDGEHVKAPRSGYLQAIDSDGLMKLAREHDLVVHIQHHPGDFVIQGTTIAHVFSANHLEDGVIEHCHSAFILGSVRTQQQDVTFAIHQLVEIAVRALSPGTNDPFTAMACVERLGVALCALADRAFPSRYRYDDNGDLRIIAAPIEFHSFIDASFDQIRQYGRTSVAVSIRLLEVLADCLACSRTNAQRDALLRQAEMVWRGSLEAQPEPNDCEQITVHYHRVLAAAQVPLV